MRKGKWRYPFEINSGVIYCSDWEKHERHQLEFDDQSHLRGDRVRWFLNGLRLGTGASINEVAAPIMF